MKVIFLNDLLGDLGHALRLVCCFLWAQKGKCNKNDFNLNGCFTLEKFLFFFFVGVGKRKLIKRI